MVSAFFKGWQLLCRYDVKKWLFFLIPAKPTGFGKKGRVFTAKIQFEKKRPYTRGRPVTIGLPAIGRSAIRTGTGSIYHRYSKWFSLIFAMLSYDVNIIRKKSIGKQRFFGCFHMTWRPWESSDYSDACIYWIMFWYSVFFFGRDTQAFRLVPWYDFTVDPSSSASFKKVLLTSILIWFFSIKTFSLC